MLPLGNLPHGNIAVRDSLIYAYGIWGLYVE
jgi:hypothetical protein